MKGLLLKDFYLIIKYCRYYMLILAVFIVASCFGNDNVFFSVYPTMIAGLVPVTLISYDEREKWNIFSATLPYTKAQIVSSKYIVGLIFELAVFILSSAAQAYRLSAAGQFTVKGFGISVLVVFVIGLVGPSLLLPFIFRFGAEKGRIIYYLFIGALCAGVTALSGSGYSLSKLQNTDYLYIIIVVAAVAVYALSWRVSVVLYRRREL